MDYHGNHRYHPYATLTDAHYEKHPGTEWYQRDHPHFPSGCSGGQNGRHSIGHRGTGTPQILDRGRMYQSGRPNERHFDSIFEKPQQRRSPPWYQGRSLNYGPPRPATNYPLGNHRVHYRRIRYGPQPRLHLKSLRPASSHPTDQTNVSNVTSSPPSSTTGSPLCSNNVKPKATVSVAPSQETDVSLAQTQTNSNSVGVGEPSPLNKQPPAMDVRNPSIAKVVPFSHEPAINSAKSSVEVNTPLEVQKIDADTNLHVSPEGQIVVQSSSPQTNPEATLSVSPGYFHVSEDGCMTIFASGKDGHLQQLYKAVCRCQLRERTFKYADKGKTKGDSIVIDSDEEDENSPVAGEENIIQEKSSQSSSSDKDEPTGSCQDTPRKRARMTIENTPEKKSFPVDNSATAVGGTDTSSSMTELHSVARIVDGLRQSLGEGYCSSTSSDSFLSSSSMNIIEDSPLLANPQILQQLLDECNETARPFKKLKASPRNLYVAAKECNAHKVLALLAEGCDPNHQVVKSKGKTAMHAAAAGGYIDIMACLRLAGCDLNLVDFENRTPLFDAVSNHKFKAVEYLIECGADLAVRDTKGMTCLHVAVRQGHADLIKLLLKTGRFDINEKDDGGWTPIMWAAEDKQHEATSLLIELGANVHIRDLELNVPLHWAALSGDVEVCKLLLVENTDINSVNTHFETPLHVAAREDRYQCVQLFLSRGANIHMKNKDNRTPLEVSDPNSRGYRLLTVKAELESHQAFIRPRILHSDISRGQENVSISCINEIDDEPFPKFTFVKECLEVHQGMINWSISKFESCMCERDCRSGKSCGCSEISERQKIWYNEEGLLRVDIKRFDRPVIYECNRMCNCWSYCKNRVVQKGMQYPLQLYRTLKKGWGVRSLAVIPQGSFVCEYTGELIPDSEADDRDDDCYLFDLDSKENTCELFCIDAKHYGNISRFINHSCDPNIFPLRVFINHRDIRFPRIAFFATKDIKMHEEVCFNYGDGFWSIKKKKFYCECGTKGCKYRNPNS